MVVLSRRTKNNLVLIGEPGVGKTVVVRRLGPEDPSRRRAGNPEGQAGLPRWTSVPWVAGSRYRGDSEERLKKVLKEIKTSWRHRAVHRRDLHHRGRWLG